MGDAVQKIKDNSRLVRILAAGLFLFFVFFGIRLKGGYCFGEQVFESMGLSPWSEVNQGWFYPGILSLAGGLVSVILFSLTTKKGMKTFGYFMWGVLVVTIVCYILGLVGVMQY